MNFLNTFKPSISVSYIAMLGDTYSASSARSNDYLMFDGVASYGSFPTITLPHTSDWEITFDTVIPSAGGYFLAEKTSTNGNNRFGVLPVANSSRFFGIAGTFSGSAPITGDLVTIKIVQSSGTVSVFVDDVSYGSLPNTSDIVFDSCASRFGAFTTVPYLEGIMANLKIVIDGVDQREYWIDEKGSDTQTDHINGQDMTLFNVDQNNDWVTL